MKRTTCLILLSASVFFLLIGCAPKTTAVEVSTKLPQPGDTLPEIVSSSSNQSTSVHCPYGDTRCTEIENQILAATVRIEVHQWLNDEGRRGEHIDGGIGHATIKEGRYLVTHNHFSIPLDVLAGNTAADQIRLTVYKANGDILLADLEPKAFSIVLEDAETLVLDFGEYVDQGLFEMLGMASAEFESWQSAPITTGSVVAQINWNHAAAHVEWVRVTDVNSQAGTPKVTLDNGVIQGASGGGIFLNGAHIANNWMTITERDANSGMILSESSVGALNSAIVVSAP